MVSSTHGIFLDKHPWSYSLSHISSAFKSFVKKDSLQNKLNIASCNPETHQTQECWKVINWLLEYEVSLKVSISNFYRDTWYSCMVLEFELCVWLQLFCKSCQLLSAKLFAQSRVKIVLLWKLWLVRFLHFQAFIGG